MELVTKYPAKFKTSTPKIRSCYPYFGKKSGVIFTFLLTTFLCWTSRISLAFFLEEYYIPERFLKFEYSGATRKQIGAILNFTAYQIFGKKIKK